jgi:hypothetical protein
MVKKAKEALKMREEQVAAFREFNAALPPDDTASWTKLCKDWEADKKKANPYHQPQNCKNP